LGACVRRQLILAGGKDRLTISGPIYLIYSQ
jgi:hypothetical protein